MAYGRLNLADGDVLKASHLNHIEEGIESITKKALIAIATAEEMAAVIANATADDVGNVYMYIGETTDTFENGAIYEIEAE